MTTHEELKKLYGNLSLERLELKARTYANASNANRKELINVLTWIEMSLKYKTDPMYHDQPFRIYLYDKFMMRYTTFMQERRAFVAFEKESLEYGPKIVIKALTICGPLETPKVFKKINKNTTRSEISEIIAQHAKPQKTRPEKRSVAFLEAELSKANEKIRSLHKEIKRKDIQIIKLKATVKRYENIFDVPIGSLITEKDGVTAKA